jgi:hypothetical protein
VAHVRPWIRGRGVAGRRSAAAARGANATRLVFEDTRSGESDLYGMRIDAAGQPIDAAPFVICNDPESRTVPRVCWNGQNWLVVFSSQVPTQYYYTYQVSAARVSPAGTVLDPAGVVVKPATYYIIFNVDATFNQDEYLFTWSDNGLIGRRFNTSLQALDANPRTLAANSKVESNNNEFFVAWERQTPSYVNEIVGSRFNHNLQ